MAFDFFAIVNVLTVGQGGGGPDNSTPCSRTRPTGRPSRTSEFGYASSNGVVLFFLTITFAALTLRVTRRESYEF